MLPLFKKESLLRYIFPPYQPIITHRQGEDASFNGVDLALNIGNHLDVVVEKDTKQINKLYQSL